MKLISLLSLFMVGCSCDTPKPSRGYIFGDNIRYSDSFFGIVTCRVVGIPNRDMLIVDNCTSDRGYVKKEAYYINRPDNAVVIEKEK